MNKSEKKAYDWLIKNRNLSPKDITFRRLSTPDFLLSNGSGIEVKRLYKNCIVFHSSQLQRLDDKTEILIISDDSPEPIIVEWGNIRDKDKWKNLKIVIQDDRIIRVSNSTWIKVMQLKLVSGIKTIDELILHCVELGEKDLKKKKATTKTNEKSFDLIQIKLNEGFQNITRVLEELITFNKKTIKTGDEKNGKNKSSK